MAFLCRSIDGRNIKFLAYILIAIPFWQWDDKNLELQTDMDRFVEDGSLDDNVESFLSHDDTDPRDTVGRCMDVSKGAGNPIVFIYNDFFFLGIIYIKLFV